MIPRLCYITDGARGTGGRPLPDVIERAFRGGVRLVVVRERDLPGVAFGRLLEPLEPLRSAGLRVVVSRRADVARAYGLDGVHLAMDAIGVSDARGWLGPDALVGYSAHSGEEARRVAREGASYVTLSPIYATDSKPGASARGCGWLREATRDLAIPALALGGVTGDRIPDVLKAGAWGVAAVSALGGAADVEAAAREMTARIGEFNG